MTRLNLRLSLFLAVLSGGGALLWAAEQPARRVSAPPPASLTAGMTRLRSVAAKAHFVAYTPLELDPRPGHFRPATTAGIKADLTRLAPFFQVVVTYSCDSAQGMDQVVPIAAAKDLQVVLGIYDPKSVRELERAITLSRQYPKTVVAILVGNESLLTNRATEEDLETAARLLRAALPGMPLSTSEPITSYGGPFLSEFGQFYCPNCHHLYNGVPKTDIQAAVAWLKERCEALRARGHRLVLIKESGLPSAPTPFSPELQARYWQQVSTDLPNTRDRAIVVFEANSLPWKSETQGGASPELAAGEAHYGLWDERGTPKLAVQFLPRGR